MSNAAINRIDKQLEKLDGESIRAKVLLAVRRFRSSWVDLGRLLNEVAYGGDYKEWGYDDFEIYCARELGLKKPTVRKLMVSYNYMREYEPKRLQRFEEADADNETPTVPDYQTVELLHRARETGEIDDASQNRLHTLAFSGEEDETFLRKEIRDCLHPERAEGAGEDFQRRKEMHEILRTARTLRKKLMQTTLVPDELKERCEAVLVELEGLE